MKTNPFKVLATLIMVTVCWLLMACSVSDNTSTEGLNPSEQELADYTILFYGHGGGDLDLNILTNIKQFYEANPESYKKVKIAVSYKYSETEQLSTITSGYLAEGLMGQQDADDIVAMGGKTCRVIVDPQKEDVLLKEGVYGQPNGDYTTPDSLTSFINWAAAKCPAKNYILVFNGHGDGYMPHENLPLNTATTRGIVFDDGHQNQAITLPALTKAIKDASIRPTAIYMDACLMNCVEYVFELKDLCDYVVASTYLVPGSGGLYSSLINELASAKDIESALSNYCDACIANWDDNNKNYSGVLDEGGTPVSYYDITVTRTSSLDAFGANLRKFVDALLEAQKDYGYDMMDVFLKYIVENKREVSEVHHDLMYYDLIIYMDIMSKALPNYFSDLLMEDLDASFHQCIVKQCFSDYLTKWNCRVGYSMLLGLEGEYTVKHTVVSEEYGLPYSPEDISYFWNGKTQTNFYSDNPNIFWPIAEPEYGVWGSTGADTYEQLVFDHMTGWSRWIKVNCIIPSTGSVASMSFTSDYKSVEMFTGKFEWNGGLKRKKQQ